MRAAPAPGLSGLPAMPDRSLLMAIAVVIALPILLASLGAGQATGLVVGVVLVAVGVGAMLVTSARDRRDDG